MAGDYDLYSVSERNTVLKNIRDELDLAIKANLSVQTYYNRMTAHRDIMNWIAMWTALELKMATAAEHAVTANALLESLVSEDDGYPYFMIQHEWVCGRGGITTMDFTTATDRLNFNSVQGAYAVVATGQLTVDSWLLVEGTASNDGVYVLNTLNSSYLLVDSGFTDEPDVTSARVRVIRRNVP